MIRLGIRCNIFTGVLGSSVVIVDGSSSSIGARQPSSKSFMLAAVCKSLASSHGFILQNDFNILAAFSHSMSRFPGQNASFPTFAPGVDSWVSDSPALWDFLRSHASKADTRCILTPAVLELCKTNGGRERTSLN